MSAFLIELGHTLRRLGKSPGFCAATVLVLALGIGACTAIFGMMDKLVLRPLPYPEADRLAAVWRAVEGEFQEGQFLGPEFEDVKAGSSSFSSLAMGCPSTPLLQRGEGPEPVRGARVTSEFFQTLRVAPILGRAAFTAEESRHGGPKVAILSHETWQRLFGGDPRTVGSTVVLDGRPCLIAGVLPERFKSPTFRLDRMDLFEPLALTPEERANKGANFEVFGRLKDGVSQKQANLELKALAANLGMGRVTLRAAPLSEGLAPPYKSTMLTLAVAVGLVLLIACANVSSLLLARGGQRQGELALRTALGAAPLTLARQALLESFVLGCVGLAAGLWVAGALGKMLAAYMGLADAPPLNGAMLMAALLSALLASMLSGAIPAWQAAKQSPMTVLKEAGQPGTRRGFRTFLVVGEVALATCLLVGAGLLVRSLFAQLREDPGFDPRNTLVGSLSLPATLFPTAESRLAFLREFEDRLNALPGVEASGLGLPVPLVNAGGWSKVTDSRSGQVAKAWHHWVSPGTQAALGLRLGAGRFLGKGERDACVVSRPLAQALWPGQDPLAQSLDGIGPVVGMVEGTKEHSLGEPPRSHFYIPIDGEIPLTSFLVRTRGNPAPLAPEIRRILKELAPRLSMGRLDLLEAAVRRNANHAERTAGLMTVFALSALLLATLGIYSVLHFLAARRTREIGIRVALGARAGQVAGLILGQGLRLAVVGILAGLASGVALTVLLRSLLFGVSRLDPVAYLGAGLVVLVPAGFACLIPAIRAARVDPLVALRQE